MSNKSLAACCLRIQNLPDNPLTVLNFSPVAAESGNFNTAVLVILRRRDLKKAAVLPATLSATGALSLDLTSTTNAAVIKFRNYLSRYVENYTIEVVRADTLVRVEWLKAVGQTEKFPGFCLCAFGCEIGVPNPLPVGEYAEACPNSCSAC